MADPIRILQHRKQKLLNKKESLSDRRWKYEYAKRVKEIDCLIENFFNREWSDGDFDTGEKQCFIPDVTNCNFKTVIALYEDVNSQLAVSEQILPVRKGDKLTINGKYYEVDYVDYNFDKAIFEVVVVDDN